jgi:hypothetical protein
MLGHGRHGKFLTLTVRNYGAPDVYLGMNLVFAKMMHTKRFFYLAGSEPNYVNTRHQIYAVMNKTTVEAMVNPHAILFQ